MANLNRKDYAGGRPRDPSCRFARLTATHSGRVGAFDTSVLTHDTPRMSRSHKVQVTLNEVEYAAVRRRAEAEGRKYASVVREAIQEYCVNPDRRRRQMLQIVTYY